LQVGTPIMLSGLPDGGSVTGQVANCVPLGNDGQYFLVGASLYTHGNVWGIENPPEDWGAAAKKEPVNNAADASAVTAKKKVWPYNLVSEGAEIHPGRK
jgi:hypothetical protein